MSNLSRATLVAAFALLFATGASFATPGDITGDPDVSGADGAPSASSVGGNGEDGGQTDVKTIDEVERPITVNADGGAGGAGSIGIIGSPGGAGGDGGTATVTLQDPVSDPFTVHADGGEGGAGGDAAMIGGPGGGGGDGGSITIVVTSSVDSINASAKGGQGGPGGVAGGPSGPSGQAGVAGTIDVVLNQGAVVQGTIAVDPASDNSLTFHLDVSSAGDYGAAKSYLANAGNGVSGTFTVDGRSYSWTGFDHLVDQLNLLGASTAQVTINVEGNGQVAGGSSSGSPRYFHCLPGGEVIAIADAGGITINARQLDGSGFFRVGRMAGTHFVSGNPLGWTVAAISGGGDASASVHDQQGKLIATCGF